MKFTDLLRPATLAATLLLLPFLQGCDSAPDGDAKEDSAQTPAMQKDDAVVGGGAEQAPVEVRVYGMVPPFALQDQDANPFGNLQVRAKPWVANFIFTSCKDVCPQQTAQLASFQKSMAGHKGADTVQYVSISVDPEHDTPAVMREYAQQYSANFDQWHFLTGDREAIWDLSKDGFKLPVAADPGNTDMPIMHGSRFVLVDQQGRVRGYYDSQSEQGLADLRRDLDVVLREWVPFPADVMESSWLAERAEAQIAAAKDYAVFHDFGFEDRIEASGITFRHRIVDDAGLNYKAVHYDHGNGIAIADIDGDGLYDIYFTTQVGANEMWRNKGDGTFVDVTEAAGAVLKMDDRISVGAAFADIDNDGDPDLYVTSVRAGNKLFANDGKGRFTDITEAAGVGHQGHSSGAVFFDYNRDGLLDLFVTNVGQYTSEELITMKGDSIDPRVKGEYQYYDGFKDAFAGHLKPERTEQSILYRNEGNQKFVDVSAETGLQDTGWSGDASPIDVNEDGWPDLYVLSMQGQDEYYENVEGKKFVKKSRELFPKTSWGAMGIQVFDYNNDGKMDIFITDMHSDMSEDIGPDSEQLKSRMRWPESFLATGGQSVFGNSFFENQGDGTFKEVSDKIGVENYWPWGLSVADINADGYADAFLASSMSFPFRYGANSLLLNNEGKGFLGAEFVLGIEPRRDGRKASPVFAAECGGRDKENRACEGFDHNIVVWGAYGTRSSAIFDIDADGDLDIVTGEFNTEPMVLISNLAEKKPDLHWLMLKLTGVKSNRDGLGAKVVVSAGGKSYTRIHDGKSGYLSQSSLPLYFGLGDATEIDEIVVTWPSGDVQTVKGPLEVNKQVEFREEG